MFLYDSKGQPLDLKKSEVPQQNESIIGLKYDQFIKSIILSQGEFAKFLKADKNERGQLLEDITGTSIYRNIGKKAYEKHKEANQQLEQKKQFFFDKETLLINISGLKKFFQFLKMILAWLLIPLGLVVTVKSEIIVETIRSDLVFKYKY